MPRLLIAPDIHCWPEAYPHDTPGGPSRLIDWRDTAYAMLRAAWEHGVRVAVFPGDLFRVNRPSPTAILEVASLFRAFEHKGIAVVACEGNHDATAPTQSGPIDILGAIGGPNWAIREPEIVDIEGVQIAVLPWARPSSLLLDDEPGDPAALAQATSEALLAIARGFAAQIDPSRPAILVGHWALSGAIMSGGQALSPTEPVLPVHELAALPFQAVIMGHIHKPQVLHERPLIAHVGALERQDFGEEHDERRCLIFDTDTGEWEWVDLPARPLRTFRAELSSPADVDAWYTRLAEEASAHRDAILRVIYRAPEDVAKLVDHDRIRAAVAGCHHLAGVYPEIIRSERVRAAGLTETTDPMLALRTWLSMRPELAPETRERAVAAAQALMREVA